MTAPIAHEALHSFGASVTVLQKKAIGQANEKPVPKWAFSQRLIQLAAKDFRLGAGFFVNSATQYRFTKGGILSQEVGYASRQK